MRLFFARAFRKDEILVEDVLDPEEDVTKTGASHQRASGAPRAAIGAVMPWTR